MQRSNLLSGILYGKRSWILYKIFLGPKVNKYSKIGEHENFFALEANIILYPFTSGSHILTVTNM